MVERDDLITPDSVHLITSGGEQKTGEPTPAMFATKGQAGEAFRRALADFLESIRAEKWRMMTEAIADKWHITIMDGAGTHRIADMRWSVSAKVGVTLSKESNNGGEARVT